MRTYCFEENKDWDERVHMSFAVRESVIEVLGFSLFELVFGHIPQGPLKLLKEAWLTTDPPQDVLTQVTDVHDTLLRVTEFAKKNLQSAKHT